MELDNTPNLLGFRILLWREVHRFLRLANQTLVPPLLTVVLYILIFGYSLGSRISNVQDVSYMHFIIPGLVMMSVISSAYANTSSSVFISRFQCNIQELLVSPLSNLEIVGAIVLGGMLRGLCVGVIVGTTSILMTGISMAHPLLTLYFMTLVALIFSCAGFLAAVWADDFDRLSLGQTYILTPLTYLGGVFFSVDMLPGFWRTFAMGNPILYFVNGMRFGFLGVSDVNIGLSTLAVLLLSAVAFYACYALFRSGYKIKT
ncbi:MAG: ABC transporter permease [Verrucomicrobia bacterium]|nr:ABC transporter permease [Verrucomicrobiota bacterium]